MYWLLLKEIQSCFNPSLDVVQISPEQLARPLITLNIFAKVVIMLTASLDELILLLQWVNEAHIEHPHRISMRGLVQTF